MKLEKIRPEIDIIDQKLIHLLTQRMELSLKVGQIKREQGLEIFDAKREMEIYNNIKKNGGKYTEGLEAVYKTILEYSKTLQ